MRGLCPVTRVVFCVIIACLLTSCFPVWIPQQFAKVEEVYSSPQVYQITSEVPSDSYKKLVFNAPYADVFRLVEVAVTQAGQNIEFSDKSKGLILAETVVGAFQHQWRYGHSAEGRFFYAITLKELGSKTTEVTIFVKAQVRCVNHRLPVISRQCTEEMSVPHWASDKDADNQGLSQLINMIRNNLIAAGLN
jgi:hypothetical protein